MEEKEHSLATSSWLKGSLRRHTKRRSKDVNGVYMAQVDISPCEH